MEQGEKGSDEQDQMKTRFSHDAELLKDERGEHEMLERAQRALGVELGEYAGVFSRRDADGNPIGDADSKRRQIIADYASSKGVELPTDPHDRVQVLETLFQELDRR